MRIVFAGTPEVAVPTLRMLAESMHDVVSVVTRPPAPSGRKRVLTPSPIARAAQELGVPTIDAHRLDEGVTDEIAALDPDLGVIVAYGGLVRTRLLAVPRHGWINLHFSLLPRWRGAAPVQRAVMAGDTEVGATVFQLVEELDAGEVFAELREAVEEKTAGELLESLSETGAVLTLSVVESIAAGSATAVPQRGEATTAAKLDATDGIVDWVRPTRDVVSLIRGVTPEPGASTFLGDTRVKILAVRQADAAEVGGPGRLALQGRRALVGTADGAVELVSVQPAGKKAMTGEAWLRGLGALDGRSLR